MKLLTALRCLVFDILLYLMTITVTLVCSPLLISYRAASVVTNSYMAMAVFLMRYILGIRCDFHPQKAVISGGRGRILAAKHQSAWETIALRYYYPNSVGVAKRVLFWLPIGWYMWRIGYIPLDRAGGAKSLQRMMRTVQKRLDSGLDVLIYPEGTRRAVDASPDYKTGIYGLYRYCAAEVLPIAHNSGLYWGKNRPFSRCAGEIRVSEGETIPHGLSKADFMAALERQIEGEYTALIALDKAEQHKQN